MPTARRRLLIRGRVQGVGFRPHVVRLARELGLTGRVGNEPAGVVIEVEGPIASLDRFQARVVDELPPLAWIHDIVVTTLALAGDEAFSIAASGATGAQDLAITPDAATCAACLAEIRDPADRRHAYPFANCTDCGPRYSIIDAVPYDRPRTTMRDFAMCAACHREYTDPDDRRFHAQPNACPVCGPQLWLEEVGEPEPRVSHRGPAALAATAARLAAGAIVAIKGLGGFHLACRADDPAALAHLRARKQRESKPFAVMVRDLATARRLAIVPEAAADLLASPAAPIVLLPRRTDPQPPPVADTVAPDTDQLGLFLPYTPLHHLLLRAGPAALVMTSANPAGEPLTHANDEARSRLSTIADAILFHDRRIARPIDDSVIMADPDGATCTFTPVRRARGYVPDPIFLTQPVPLPVLSLGGDLKSTLCLAADERAVLGEHLGDLAHPAAFRAFVAAGERLAQLLAIAPERVACDLHPGYHSARHAAGFGLPLVRVQHHHAHVVACAAEHGHGGPLLGIACDGTGYGDDGSIWGGELLLVDGPQARRLGHLAALPLLGGDAAAYETWRPAVGLLHAAFGADWRQQLPRTRLDLPPQAAALAATRLANGRGTTPCSSLGRLFDAVAALLGVATCNRHEGDAAIRLEALAHAATPAPLSLPLRHDGTGMRLDSPALARQLLDRLAAGSPPAALARGFHDAVADAFVAAAIAAADDHGVRTVALTGGCLLNRLLRRGMRCGLEQHGLRVLTHRRTPPGDGCLALGQALIAAHSPIG